MKKTKPYNDQGLRLALQHRNEAAEKMKPSADFADRLMQRIEEQTAKPKHRRVWLYSGIAAAAASVALLIALHKPQPTVPLSKEEVVTVDWYAMNCEQGILEKQYSHQREIQEKGERLIAHIQQQKITEK